MSTLLTADLHLTDKQKDEYRWGIFPWIKRIIKRKGIKKLCILGDLTDKKDRHSAELVNRITNILEDLSKVVPIYILKGNHDYLKEEHPFFEFVTKIENITFISDIVQVDDFLFLSNTRTPSKDWETLDTTNVRYAFMHQSVIGAATSSGYQMEEGLTQKTLKALGVPIISGDIHVPQDVGVVTYVGSPYPINFGDDYKPRLLILHEDNDLETIHFPTIKKKKLVISSFKELEESRLKENDQLKIIFELDEVSYDDWHEIRKSSVEFCKKNGIILSGIEFTVPDVISSRELSVGDLSVENCPIKTLERFSKIEKVNKELLEVGIQLLEELEEGD